MTFAIGENVGPYRITDKLGQGGMATVYRAYHANLDRYVALKVLHAILKEDPNFLARFRREAQIVARLEHPSIIPIYDYSEYNGEPYLVMRFIEGETLKARLARKPLTLEETLKIMTAVGQALTYAHEQGVLHRDIKPSNILLEKGTEPFIADFGLARMASAGESTLSKDTMLGTPQYMSPEQGQGIQDLDAGTDIYSLGVVLYEIVVGRVPFNADTPYAIVHDHIYSPLPLPSAVNPQVPRLVERVLLKALAKDRTDRYPSAVALVDAFRDAVRESDLKELSAATYRMPAPSAATPDSATPTPPGALPPGVPPSPPGAGVIASPVPGFSAPTIGTSTAQRYARQQRRATLWKLGGLAGLLVTCLAGLFVTVFAFGDANIRASLFVDRPTPTVRPAQLTATVQPTAPTAVDTATSASVAQSPSGTPAAISTEPATAAPTDDTALADAQKRVAEHPDDPMAHTLLALLLYRDGKLLLGAQQLTEALRLAKNDPAVLMPMARQASKASGPNNIVTALIYADAYAFGAAGSPAIRDEAGQYIYRYTRSNRGARDLQLLKKMADLATSGQSAGLYAFVAVGYQNAGRNKDAQDALNEAIKLNVGLAEVYLAQGILYAAQNDTDNARTAFMAAAAANGAPGWLIAEARVLSSKGSNQ
jgi:serine/threonine protein kinase/Flp pilus assembly protein TadD